MRYALVVAMLLGSSGFALANETVDNILNGASPYFTVPCTDNVTGRSGVCGLFAGHDGTTYMAIKSGGEIIAIRQMLPQGGYEQVYTVSAVEEVDA